MCVQMWDENGSQWKTLDSESTPLEFWTVKLFINPVQWVHNIVHIIDLYTQEG